MNIRKLIGLVFIACGGGGVFMSALFFMKPDLMLYLVGASSDVADYKAVTLVNKAMFIGKTQDIHVSPVVLSHVFYLKTSSSSAKIKTPVTSLQKLGEGDNIKTDVLKIKKKDILYIQSIKLDSPILRLIKEYYAQKERLKQKVEVPTNP